MENRVPPRSEQWRSLSAVGSVVICVAISLCLLVQPDWLAPVVLIPTWCWLIPGFALAMSADWWNHKLRFIAVLALWGVFIVLFVEEARSLIRFKSWPTVERQASREGSRTIRVVSLNCNVAQLRSAEEVVAWNPDVVLLQESPGSVSLGRLSQKLFGADGAFLYGGDVSILTNGQIQPKFSNRASHFVHAEVELPSGFRTDVISLRLAPPVFRLDFWMP